MVSEYQKAKDKLLANFDKNCQQFFAKKGHVLELGYCKLLQDDLNSAKKLFLTVKESDIRAKWALLLISLIEGDVREYPTYFEIRNFLEIDLNILLHYYKGDYVEKIIRYADFMFSINPEVHKFIGRVLYNNGYEEQAMFFLDRARNYFYNDPELHFLLAYIFYNKRDYITSKRHVDDCLQLLPQYFPAIDLDNKITKKQG